MFWHIYKYRVKSLLKTKMSVFWAFIYPILLGTLFFVTFGNSINKNSIETIDVAIVKETESEKNDSFVEMMEEVEFEDGKRIFNILNLDLKSAEEQLEDESIVGIVRLGDEITLEMGKGGLGASILKEFADEYTRSFELIEDAATIDYTRIQDVIDVNENRKEYVEEVSLGGEKIDTEAQYFYALIGMACLFGSFIGMVLGKDIQAVNSPIGARKTVSGTKRLTLMMGDLAAAVSIHFVGLLLVVTYLKYILKIPVFSQPLPCIAVVFLGCVMGVELGQFASCVAKGSEGMTIAISLAISLGSSALSGLMSPDLKRLMDRVAPIVSRLNPSSAIADCFYSLSIYSDYTRFAKSLTILAVEAVVLVVLSFFAVRRNKYVSV